METTEYLDVFKPTEQVESAMTATTWIGATFFLVGAALMFVCLTLRKRNNTGAAFVTLFAVGWSALAFAFVLGVNLCMKIAEYQNINHEAHEHIQSNIQEKYGDQIQVLNLLIPHVEERDDYNDYSLVFSSESHKDPTSKQYRIRFDRQTSEPFVENLQPINQETAK